MAFVKSPQGSQAQRPTKVAQGVGGLGRGCCKLPHSPCYGGSCPSVPAGCARAPGPRIATSPKCLKDKPGSCVSYEIIRLKKCRNHIFLKQLYRDILYLSYSWPIKMYNSVDFSGFRAMCHHLHLGHFHDKYML